MGTAVGSLNDASLSMTVDRAGSFGRPIGLATGLAVFLFGLVDADLLEEAATGFGPSPTALFFFSTTKVSNYTGGIEWRPAYLGRVLRERGLSFQEPFSWVNAEAVESREDQMGQRAVPVTGLSVGEFPLVCAALQPSCQCGNPYRVRCLDAFAVTRRTESDERAARGSRTMNLHSRDHNHYYV